MKTLITAIIIAIASLSLFSCTKSNLEANGRSSSISQLKSLNSLDGDNGNNENSEAKTILTVDFSTLDSFHAEAQIIVTDLNNANVYTFASLDTLPLIQAINIHRYHQYKVEYKNYNSEGATWMNYSGGCEHRFSWSNSSIMLLTGTQYATAVNQPVMFEKDPTMSFSVFGCAFY